MIAFAPTYAAIGFAAPLIMVLARLLQGFATGGEFASATSFLIESAPADQRGYYGSWQMVGQGVALLLGALVSAAVTRGLSPEALDGWGWRIPFLLGLAIGPVGLYIRRRLNETEAFIEACAAPQKKHGLGTILATHPMGSGRRRWLAHLMFAEDGFATPLVARCKRVRRAREPFAGCRRGPLRPWPDCARRSLLAQATDRLVQGYCNQFHSVSKRHETAKPLK
jgi:MFS family permease